MAHMILTYEVRPENGEVEYSDLEKATKSTIENFDSSVKLKSIKPKEMAFGMMAVEVYFSMDEKFGTDAIEEKLLENEEVGDAICLSMSRALG